MRSNKCSIAIYMYVSMRRNTTQHIFLSYVYLCVSFLNMYVFVIFHYFPFFHFIFKSIISLSRETRGEPPPDVVSGENVTLPSSFIALRREAIKTMIFSPFLFCSYIYSLSFSLFVLFSFNKILTIF